MHAHPAGMTKHVGLSGTFNKEFCVLQAYTHQMAACLAELPDSKLSEEGDFDCPAVHRLHELIIECGSLLVITLVSNPGGFKDLQNCKFDEGVVCPDAQPPSFYCGVMVRWPPILCVNSEPHQSAYMPTDRPVNLNTLECIKLVR